MMDYRVDALKHVQLQEFDPSTLSDIRSTSNTQLSKGEQIEFPWI